MQQNWELAEQKNFYEWKINVVLTEKETSKSAEFGHGYVGWVVYIQYMDIWNICVKNSCSINQMNDIESKNKTEEHVDEWMNEWMSNWVNKWMTDLHSKLFIKNNGRKKICIGRKSDWINGHRSQRINH